MLLREHRTTVNLTHCKCFRAVSEPCLVRQMVTISHRDRLQVTFKKRNRNALSKEARQVTYAQLQENGVRNAYAEPTHNETTASRARNRTVDVTLLDFQWEVKC